MPAGGRVDSVAPSPHTPGKAFITVLRYQFDDWKPYIYRTENYGSSWKLITDGIPQDFPVRVVRESPDHEGLLIAGTEFGMFVSVNDGETWEIFQQNLPITPITDVKFIRGDLAVSTMGRGFWVLDNIQSVASAGRFDGDSVSVFKPANTFRYRRPRGVPRDGTSDGVPDLPKPTVSIDYFIPKGEYESIRLEILDAQNDFVTAYVNNGLSANEDNKDSPNYILTDNLQMRAGLNRFRWDMSRLGPWNANSNRRYSDGPIAAPGLYSVRLIIDGQVAETSFELIIDPRVTVQGIKVYDIAAQNELQGNISSLLTKARKLEMVAKNEHVSLHKRYRGKTDIERGSEVNSDFDRVHGAIRALSTPNIIYPKAGLVGMISYLYNINSDADQIPGRDSIERFAELTNEYNTVEAAYSRK